MTKLENKQLKPETAQRIRMRKVAKNVVENGRSVSGAMRDAGYSPVTATHPQKLTKSKTWMELMDEMVPENKVTQVLNAQLNATDVRFDRDGKAIKTPDNQARLKAVDIAIRVRGGYAPDKQVTAQLNFSLADLRRMRDNGEI